MADYKYVETRADLEALAQELLGHEVVAFDTEADSFYHYFEKICLVQVATRQQSYLIDPIALGGASGLAPLGPVFAARKVRKIFHAADYDVFLLKRDCGFRFVNLFDTMLSAQLLGYASIGLTALIKRHFEVSLPKDEQRSDWSHRPLRESQLTYAAADVTYLISLAEKLEAELEAAGRLRWAHEEFELATRREWPDRRFDETGYLKIKGVRELDREGLATARQLYQLRDARAREIDRPAFKVLGNRTLLEISAQKPTTLGGLAEIKGISELIQKRMGRELLDAVNTGLKHPHGPLPRSEGSGRRRMDRKAERRVGHLKLWRAKRAADLSLDPGVFCPNSALEAIACRNPSLASELSEIPELKAWFAREFAPEVVEALRLEVASSGES